MIHQTIFDNFAKKNAMELDRYRALVCAIETGSLSAAAEALQYTPSGVSRMVAALEEETGVPLLLREHSGVRPTKECEKLLPPSATYCTRARAAPSSPRSCAGWMSARLPSARHTARFIRRSRASYRISTRATAAFRCSCAVGTAQS